MMTADKKEQKGTILVVNTGSITTKFAVYKDGSCILEQKLEHSVQELSRFADVMDQDQMRTDAIISALGEQGIRLEDIDIVMCRGGLFTPCVTGVYNVNADMREVLSTSREGNHACNLSALIGDNIAHNINALRDKEGLKPAFGPCIAYVADPPMADEMLPECHVGGIPEFPRRTLFHALNTRAIMRRYLRDTGRKAEDTTAIICHMGGGVTISLHRGDQFHTSFSAFFNTSVFFRGAVLIGVSKVCTHQMLEYIVFLLAVGFKSIRKKLVIKIVIEVLYSILINSNNLSILIYVSIEVRF